jgi:hypothetical protein
MSARASLQAVLREHLDAYRQHHLLSPHQWQVCHHVLRCRTPLLGGLHLQCDHCERQPIVYHACRDRHCPRCQRQASLDWCARQSAAVLPVTYHHLVFTLPEGLNDWIERAPGRLYALLFESAWATLSAFGRDPKRLDGQLGATAVLHTWGQTLVRHVHLHVLCPGGALGDDGQWHPAKSTYLFPVRALARHFRGGFISRLRRAIKRGECPDVGDDADVRTRLDALMATDWVVYSKPVLTATDQVVDYLGRYSHRIALSDHRLQPGSDGQVRLKYKDYRDNRHKIMDLDPQELIRRYLLHVLPKGLMRIRHYGFLANRCRRDRIPVIRQAIDRAAAAGEMERSSRARTALTPPAPKRESWPCRHCHRGRLWVLHTLPPQRDEGG